MSEPYEFVPVVEAVDLDADGVAETVIADYTGDAVADEVLTDVTGDGVADYGVMDTNADGVVDVVGVDTGYDGVADVIDVDSDYDGTLDTTLTDSALNQDAFPVSTDSVDEDAFPISTGSDAIASGMSGDTAAVAGMVSSTMGDAATVYNDAMNPGSESPEDVAAAIERSENAAANSRAMEGYVYEQEVSNDIALEESARQTIEDARAAEMDAWRAVNGIDV
jgi:hypothetical protein